MSFIKKCMVAAAMCSVAFVGNVEAQYRVAPYKYAVKFTDKNDCGYSLDKPGEFLTQKALDRRAKFNIPLDEYDLPMNMKYVDSLKQLGFYVYGTSKWLNCALIAMEDTLNIAKLNDLSFVDVNYEWRKPKTKEAYQNDVSRPKKLKYKPLPDKHVYNYGDGTNQCTMLNVHKLHGQGFTGKGMTVAIFDAGFYKADELPTLATMFKEGRVLGVRDFHDRDSVVYDSDNHGMNVLSCIAANLPAKMVGTAPDVSAYLFRTEVSSSENIIEEFYWACAAEVADSLGVDLIHSSLGYQDFDDKSASYKYQECDGNTTIASIAADRAASKGIVVTVSAGNGGDDDAFPWITSPADADSVLAVGAVNSRRELAYFSSRGTSFDGRVKPDVCAQGVSSAVQGASGRITRSNGTSFAGPILAGGVLCLMQAHPTAPVIEILNAVRASGDIWNKPNKDYGYGIPDFEVAHQILIKKKY